MPVAELAGKTTSKRRQTGWYGALQAIAQEFDSLKPGDGFAVGPQKIALAYRDRRWNYYAITMELPAILSNLIGFPQSFIPTSLKRNYTLLLKGNGQIMWNTKPVTPALVKNSVYRELVQKILLGEAETIRNEQNLIFQATQHMHPN